MKGTQGMKRIIAALCLLLPLPAVAQTGGDGAQRAEFLRAAQVYIDQAVTEGCMGAGGRMVDGVQVLDLDGDGNDDLLLGHFGLQCQGRSTRSGFCGMQICSSLFYLWRNGTLVLSFEILGDFIRADARVPPGVTFSTHGNPPGTLRWNGREFRRDQG